MIREEHLSPLLWLHNAFLPNISGLSPPVNHFTPERKDESTEQ